MCLKHLFDDIDCTWLLFIIILILLLNEDET